MTRRILLLLAVLCLPACAGAQDPKKDAPARKTLPAWSEAAGWDLYRGGAEDGEARVFQSADFQKYLVVPGAGEEVFLLTLKSKEVGRLPRTALTVTGEELALGTATPAAEAPFTRKDSDILFTAGGTAFRLTPEPPLVGEISRADLLNKKRDYVAAARAYKPKSGAVSLLKNVSQPVEIVVFFGTWCSYCKEHLPRFLKALEAAGNPNIQARYIGMSEDMSQPEALLTEYGVSKTPTFVVSMGGRELGRIVEKPQGAIEEDLALLLMGGR
jgi:thiol-disulfide isomerase/thioredoxin